MTRTRLTFAATIASLALALSGCGREASFSDELADDGAVDTASSSSTLLSGSNCTRPGAWWKANNRYAALPANQLPWPLDEDMPACSGSVYHWVSTTPAKGDVWHQLVRSAIGVMLNRAQGAYVPIEVRSALNQAKPLLMACTVSAADEVTAWSLMATLDTFTNGTVGPGPCP